MNVTLFGKYHGNHGPSRVTAGLSRALAERGHAPTVFTYGDRDDPPHPDVQLESVSPMPSSVREWQRLYRDVKRRVGATDADVFHALERYPYTSDVRTVQWTSDMAIMWERTGRRPPIQSLAGEVLMNWFSRKGALSSDVIVAQSPETVRQMHRLWRARADKVIPLGILENFRHSPGKTNRPPKALLVGRIDPRKGQRPFLNHLCPGDGGVDLTIVGGISDYSYAESALEGWWEHHVGYLSDEDLKREYESADIVIVPSNLENFSMVGLEAMAKGCTLIITKGCGLAQFDWATPSNGIHVADDGKNAAEILRDISSSNNIMNWKCDAYNKTEKLTWGDIANSYIECYRESINI
ncbi:glycosyltransferase family 4 protein [Salinarchaeum laminariae]|uniref:glycosyltransferase family 4 protein n=1 Tax=Salinarchaeum laminariae TaxID=869888 RepID=UPI0020C07030|nr:glycosyltransferase family 4 protein [Salinarchaeum laminariae]